MMAESSNDVSSIPTGGMSVKQILHQVLFEGSVRPGVLSVEVAAGTSPEVLGEACQQVFRAASRITVSASFSLGDMYQSTKPYSQARHLLTEWIDKNMGAAYAERLRHFGSVAKRWPKDRRSDKYAWEYYRTHKPGEVGRADVAVEKRAISLKEVASEDVGGVEVLTLEGHGGQKYTVRRPRIYEDDDDSGTT